MALSETNGFISVSGAPPLAVRGFAEPDWQGDGDYKGDLDESELDDRVAALEIAIGAGRDAGRLGEYHARRAAFDLQSIRAQIAREKRCAPQGVPQERMCAIFSRLDRLTSCLQTPAAEHSL